MTGHEKQYVLSVLVPDRVGILSEITMAVTDLGANIVGISQTVVRGYFTVILIAEFQHTIPEQAVRDAVLGRFRSGEASVIVRPFHTAKSAPAGGERYILTMSGKDRTGILKALTGYLAEKGINIEDLFFRIVGEHVTHIGEVTVPGKLDIKQVQNELSGLRSSPFFPVKVGGCNLHGLSPTLRY